jgi:hypothetical protein
MGYPCMGYRLMLLASTILCRIDSQQGRGPRWVLVACACDGAMMVCAMVFVLTCGLPFLTGVEPWRPRFPRW